MITPPDQAAAGLWSTSEDWANFLIEISKGYRKESKVFSKALVSNLLAEPIEHHAYGFILVGEGEDLTLVHHGGNVGYRSTMMINLASGDGAAFLTNSDNGSALIGELLRSISHTYGWSHFNQLEFNARTRKPEELRPFVGEYEFKQHGWRVKVVYDQTAKNISVIFPNHDRYHLVPTTEAAAHFVHPETGVEVRFEQESNGHRIHLYGQIGNRI